jgi:large subunit ribosomal protein L18
MKSRADRYALRRLRVRRKIFGTTERPRLSVYRSLKHIYAQVIDDLQGKTLAAASSQDKGFAKTSGKALATAVGETVAKRAVEKGIKKVVFDRGARSYQGRVKAVGDGARQGGLEF